MMVINYCNNIYNATDNYSDIFLPQTSATATWFAYIHACIPGRFGDIFTNMYIHTYHIYHLSWKCLTCMHCLVHACLYVWAHSHATLTHTVSLHKRSRTLARCTQALTHTHTQHTCTHAHSLPHLLTHACIIDTQSHTRCNCYGTNQNSNVAWVDYVALIV